MPSKVKQDLRPPNAYIWCDLNPYISIWWRLHAVELMGTSKADLGVSALSSYVTDPEVHELRGCTMEKTYAGMPRDGRYSLVADSRKTSQSRQ